MAPADPHDAVERLLTRDEVAARLHVSVRTVDRLVASGDLPARRIGRSVRFKPSDAQGYVDRQGG